MTRKLLFLTLTPIFLWGNIVFANTTTVGDFTLVSDDPLFTITNAAPGQEFSSPFSIKNTGSATQDIQFSLNITADPKVLADFLYLKVNEIDSGKKICVFGCLRDQDLNKLKNSEMTFSAIDPGEERHYEFVLIFSPDAGNDLQNSKLTFDIALGYRGSVPNDNPTHHHGRGGRNNDGHRDMNIGRPGGPFTGPRGNIIGPAANAQEPENQSRVAGESTPEEGLTEGVSVAACHGWPEWVWVIFLIAYTLILWSEARRNYKKEKYAWKLSLLWTVAAIAFWCYFDRCREFDWFWRDAVIIAIFSHFIYLWFLRRKVKLSVSDNIEKGD